jgi:hypothetical protein
LRGLGGVGRTIPQAGESAAPRSSVMVMAE